MRQVLASDTARKQLDDLPSEEKRRLARALQVHAEDPYRSRPGADIKKVEGTDPAKYRLRVGDWRAVYWVGEDEVRVLEIFRRGRGYRLE
jgi:mRNA interferase RelE/StbE